MNSKEFLLNKLNSLVHKFPGIEILYQFDNQINTHIVEIHPFSIFESLQEYRDLETEISFEFDETYTSENLLFVSSNSLCKVVTPDLVLTGILYNIIPEIIEPEIYKFTFPNSVSYLTDKEIDFAKAA
jgi:hypothetical protein